MKPDASRNELASVKTEKRLLAREFQKASKRFDREMARLNRREKKLQGQLAAH